MSDNPDNPRKRDKLAELNAVFGVERQAAAVRIAAS
jgi:hypothetical protein